MATTSERLEAAKRVHRAGRPDEAIPLYLSVIRDDPKQAAAWYFLGVAYHGLGRLDQSVDSLRAAVRAAPSYPEAFNYLGVVLAASGRFDEAMTAFRTATAQAPRMAEAHRNLAIACDRAGRLGEAVEACRRAAEIEPGSAEAQRALGVALRKTGDFAGAAQAYRRAVVLQPDRPEAYSDLGLLLEKSGAPADAEATYREALGRGLRSAELLSNLGALLGKRGAVDEAVAFAREAVRLKPGFAGAWNNLGVLLEKQDEWAESARCYEEAVRLEPNLPAPHYNLGSVLGKQGRFADAEAACRRAIAVDPGSAEARHNLAFLLAEVGRLNEALREYEQALRLNPEFVETLYNLGGLLGRVGRLDEAEDACRRALAVRPDCAEALSNLGFVQVEQGRISEGKDSYEAALRLLPESPSIRSSYLFCLQYDPTSRDDTLLAEARRWGELVGGTVSPAVHPRPGPADEDRPLRIGYVSPDLRRHPVASFLEPILAHHDPSRVEAFCYAEVAAPDPTTDRLRGLSRGWRSTCGLGDDAVAELVRRDRIDILVDLAGHTARNRLAVFARKPAPVQVTYLGYPGTTGLAAVDYLLTDAVVDPEGEAAWSTEALERLPGGFCVFAPPSDAPAVAPSPFRRNGGITFGSLHKLSKINDRVLDLWAALLRAVPGARLLIYRNHLAGRRKDEIRSALEGRGIEPDRLDLRHEVEGGQHLAAYSLIDLSLDVFPWCGHTTACESLWMGVPVVTLSRARHATRMTASVLEMVGLPEFVAATPEAFVAIAARWAADPDRLERLRLGLRERMAASRLCDGAAFTRELEAAYRKMWRRWSRREA